VRAIRTRASRIVRQTLCGQIYVPDLAKSTHYQTVYAHPNWMSEIKKMVGYGIHNFYQPTAWGSAVEKAAWGRETRSS